mmetsp:Transcript_22959/g.59921  ORF Transcript_22959/g.59921 Transcript_22959/m.59921 type:complete len:325 (+) Transcript_22959:890-1864(+)
MARDLRNRAPRDDQLDAGILDALDELVHPSLVVLREAGQLLGVIQQHGALRLRARRFDALRIHRHLALLLEALHAARGARDGHALHDEGALHASAVHLRDAHVVDVEVAGPGRHGLDARLRDQLGQRPLQAQLLGRDGRLDALLDLVNVFIVRNRPCLQGRQHVKALLVCEIVPLVDVARVDALLEKLLGSLQELPPQADHEVGGVPALLLLRLRGHDDQLGRRVHHLQLGDHRVRVARHEVLAQVVHDKLVHAVGPEGRLGDLGEPLARLDVAQEGLVHAGEVLAAILEEARDPGLLLPEHGCWPRCRVSSRGPPWGHGARAA